MLSQRQEEIILASVKLISQNGIQGFTTKSLAAEIGISEPAIYRHFSGKTEILRTMLMQFEQYMKKILKQTETSDKPPFETIISFFEHLAKKFIENPSYVTVIFADEIYSNEKTLSDKIAEIMETVNTKLLLIIQQGQQNQTIRNDVDALHIILIIKGAVRLMVKKWKKGNCTSNLKTDMKQLLNSIGILILIK